MESLIRVGFLSVITIAAVDRCSAAGLCKNSDHAEAVVDVPNRFAVLCGLAASRAVIGLGLMLNGWPRPGASTRCPTDPSSTLGGIGGGPADNGRSRECRRQFVFSRNGS